MYNVVSYECIVSSVVVKSVRFTCTCVLFRPVTDQSLSLFLLTPRNRLDIPLCEFHIGGGSAPPSRRSSSKSISLLPLPRVVVRDVESSADLRHLGSAQLCA